MFRLTMIFMFLVPSILQISQAKTSNGRVYPLTVSNNGVDYNELVTVDINKNSERFRLREASTNMDAGDIVYDFNKKKTLFRIPENKACFLRNSIGNIPSPADLQQLLKLMNRTAAVKLAPKTGPKLKVAGKVHDRSGLSEEMRDLCKKLPIYLVTKDGARSSQNDAFNEMRDGMEGTPARRKKRGLLCNIACSVVCRMKCSGWICYPVCSNVCGRVCKWIGK